MNEYVYLFGGAIGDALLGVHIGRTLAANVPNARITLLSTRKNPFLKELVAPLSFVILVEMPKGNLRSWLALIRLMLKPHKSVVYEPFSSPMPLWWRLVLWCASWRAGSVEVHYQSHPRSAPKRAVVLQLEYKHENVFNTPPAVLEAWEVPVHARPRPLLETTNRRCDIAVLPPKPYAVFHFFAGIHKRTALPLLANDILHKVREAFPDHSLVITCATKEKAEAGELIEGISNARVHAGLGADALLCLLGGAAVFVGVDTGVTHLAQHLGIPTVVLGHTYNPSWLPQYNEPVRVLYSLPDIAPEEVIEAMRAVTKNI